MGVPPGPGQGRYLTLPPPTSDPVQARLCRACYVHAVFFTTTPLRAAAACDSSSDMDHRQTPFPRLWLMCHEPRAAGGGRGRESCLPRHPLPPSRQTWSPLLAARGKRPGVLGGSTGAETSPPPPSAHPASPCLFASCILLLLFLPISMPLQRLPPLPPPSLPFIAPTPRPIPLWHYREGNA